MEALRPHGNTQKTTLLQKVGIFAIALMVLIASYGVLSSMGLTPDTTSAEGAVDTTLSGSALRAGAAQPSQMPSRIQIPTIGLDVSVANPTSADSATLDAALLHGAVRYPGSGELGGDGKNVVIFGHSSYLPVVHNQAYKAFDGIQNLKAGDKIYVSGQSRVYVYVVKNVYQTNIADAGVPLAVTGNELTLITCDSFATKSDRYVVVSSLVESYPSTR